MAKKDNREVHPIFKTILASHGMAKNKAIEKKKGYGKKEYDKEQDDLLEKQLSARDYKNK